VLGAVVTAPLTVRFGAGRTMVGAVFGGACGTLLLAVAGGPPQAAAAVLVLGYGLLALTDQLYLINFASTAQALAPDSLRGRVSASIRMVTIGAAPLGAFAGGFLAEAIGLRATAVVAGVGVLLAFVWIAFSPVRLLRTLSTEPEGAPSPSRGSSVERPTELDVEPAPPAAPVSGAA
jgi:MFS family permease